MSIDIERERPQKTPKDPLQELFKNPRSMDWTNATGFRGGSVRRRKSFALIGWSFIAALIDVLILTALSCFFLMAFIKIMKMPITWELLKECSGCFLAGVWMYLVTTRFFLHATLGEAACDIRLGRPQDALRKAYFAKVLARATVILLTGIVILPLLSLMTGKDLAGSIAGLKLFSLK